MSVNVAHAVRPACANGEGPQSPGGHSWRWWTDLTGATVRHAKPSCRIRWSHIPDRVKAKYDPGCLVDFGYGVDPL